MKGARLFRGQRDGQQVGARNGQADKLLQSSQGEYELPQWAFWKKWHPSHRCDRASRRTLIALGGEPPRYGVASKVLATWVLSRTALVRFWFSARSTRGQQYFGGDSCANR